MYSTLANKWRKEGNYYQVQALQNGEGLIETPPREDVDKFIIQFAVHAERMGAFAHIDSNVFFQNIIVRYLICWNLLIIGLTTM